MVASTAVMRTCSACPVRRSCLATALLWSVDGTWAGTSLAEREQGVRSLKAGASVAEVITAMLDHADGAVARRARHRDWFHVDPATLGVRCADEPCGSDPSNGPGDPGEAA